MTDPVEEGGVVVAAPRARPHLRVLLRHGAFVGELVYHVLDGVAHHARVAASRTPGGQLLLHGNVQARLL